jgi:isoleucyl-tRNA synthetase
LNIKEVVLVEDESQISEVSYKPNFRALGPRFGKRMKEVSLFISGLTPEQVKDLAAGSTFEVAGGTIGFDDVELQRRERDGVVVAVEDNLAVGLDVRVTEELAREGCAREFVNRVQNLRKDAGLDVSDRIRLWVQGSDVIETAVSVFRDTIATETLAEEITLGSLPEAGTAVTKDLEVNDETCTVTLIKV